MMNAIKVVRQHHIGRREQPEWCFKKVGQTEATSKDEHCWEELSALMSQFKWICDPDERDTGR